MGSERKHGLPPIARKDARLLILGSLPGDASLRAERYYAHPQNQFWRLLGTVLDEELAGLGYERRLAVLQERRVALWDVIGSALRRGSLDQQMREVEARDLESFVVTLPALRGVAFNGASAARLGRRVLQDSKLTLVDLPSSSPAYTLPFAAKAERWNALRPLLVD